MSSLVISWLFAKSITNAANLGLSYGMVGGVAYAGYYLSFVVAGVIIYQLRTQGGYLSIHQFLQSRFGRKALVIFTLLIGFRLFNEVWSNTMVIGSYFGDQGSIGYYSSILVFTLLTLAYTLKGGFSSSLVTDLIQMGLFAVLLTVILAMLLPQMDWDVKAIASSGEWSFAQGGNLLLVALIQSLSYPFHDPVMTDRGFLSDAKTTLRAFLVAAGVGGICIILFSVVGIYGQTVGVSGQAPVEVAKLLGVPMMLLMNFIMITSAASTLDSTFTSFSKLISEDLGIASSSLTFGRLAMCGIALIGTIPIFLDPEILSATTVSGTMVIGLAPVFLLWRWGRSPWAFYLPVGFGLILGIGSTILPISDSWLLTQGKYNDLLVVNLFGTLMCFVLFLVGNQIGKQSSPIS